MAKLIYKRDGRRRKEIQAYNIDNLDLFNINAVVTQINGNISPILVRERLTDQEYMADNFEAAYNYQDIFKQNIIFLVHMSGIKLRDFIKLLAGIGIKISTPALYSRKHSRFIKLSYITTMGRIFGIDPALLLCANLPEIWFRAHPEQRPTDNNEKATCTILPSFRSYRGE